MNRVEAAPGGAAGSRVVAAPPGARASSGERWRVPVNIQRSAWWRVWERVIHHTFNPSRRHFIGRRDCKKTKRCLGVLLYIHAGGAACIGRSRIVIIVPSQGRSGGDPGPPSHPTPPTQTFLLPLHARTHAESRVRAHGATRGGIPHCTWTQRGPAPRARIKSGACATCVNAQHCRPYLYII